MRRTVTESVTSRTRSWWRQWFVRLHRLFVSLPHLLLMRSHPLVSVATPLWKSHSLPLILHVFTPHFSLFLYFSLSVPSNSLQMFPWRCLNSSFLHICNNEHIQIDAFKNVTVASKVLKWEDYMGIKLHNACMLVPACNWLFVHHQTALCSLIYLCVLRSILG